MKIVERETFLKNVTSGNSEYANGNDWINGVGGKVSFALKENEPILGELKRGVSILGAIRLNIVTTDGDKLSGRDTPFNLSMLPALKDSGLWKVKFDFAVEQRVSAKGNQYKQILFGVKPIATEIEEEEAKE